MTLLFVATRNAHKIQEIKAILGAGFKIVSLRDFPDAPEIAEDGATFEANAQKKSEGLAQWLIRTGHDITYDLADDSGLEVDALQGAPGVYSARFAAMDTGASGNSADAANNEKLLRCLRETPIEKRTARFRCVIALTRMEKKNGAFSFETRTFDGCCEGRIGFAVKGTHGFGYDPLFTPNGFKETFAELGETAKNQISHRSQALAKLKNFLFQPQ
jgi:XTP/dITP diphosphohydrolase